MLKKISCRLFGLPCALNDRNFHDCLFYYLQRVLGSTSTEWRLSWVSSKWMLAGWFVSTVVVGPSMMFSSNLPFDSSKSFMMVSLHVAWCPPSPWLGKYPVFPQLSHPKEMLIVNPSTKSRVQVLPAIFTMGLNLKLPRWIYFFIFLLVPFWAGDLSDGTFSIILLFYFTKLGTFPFVEQHLF